VLRLDRSIQAGDLAAQVNLSRVTGIPQSLISKWAADRIQIFENALLNPAGRKNKSVPARWLGAETHLYLRFLYRRTVKGLKVTRKWLKKEMLGLLADVSGIHKKKMSDGWASGFCRRYQITKQARNNKKQEGLEKRLPRIRDFHRWLIYGVQRSDPQRCPKYGRFPARRMFHMDQIPIPFSISSKYTLNMKGQRCWIAEPGDSGLDKRQMTLQLTIRAEGPQIVMPEDILRGGGDVDQAELDYYASLTNIRVRWQNKAWADERVCFDY
jgi:hypothetical protein